MATKGERGDVPAPWGAWLAFGVAMVCSGGLPAVVWAGHCCWAEGRLWPCWCRCGVRGVPASHCRGQPTHSKPSRGRLWLWGGAGPCSVAVGAAMCARGAPRGRCLRNRHLGGVENRKAPYKTSCRCGRWPLRCPTPRDPVSQAIRGLKDLAPARLGVNGGAYWFSTQPR